MVVDFLRKLWCFGLESFIKTNDIATCAPTRTMTPTFNIWTFEGLKLQLCMNLHERLNIGKETSLAKDKEEKRKKQTSKFIIMFFSHEISHSLRSTNPITQQQQRPSSYHLRLGVSTKSDRPRFWCGLNGAPVCSMEPALEGPLHSGTLGDRWWSVPEAPPAHIWCMPRRCAPLSPSTGTSGGHKAAETRWQATYLVADCPLEAYRGFGRSSSQWTMQPVSEGPR